MLANLLSHENSDIAIDVIEIIQELTDEDVGADVDDMAEDEAEGSSGGMATRTRMAMGELIDDLASQVSFKLYIIIGKPLTVTAKQLGTGPASLKFGQTGRKGRYRLSRCIPHPRRL